MKQEILDKLNILSTFLDEMEAINKNPYSAGLKTEQLLTDLKGFTKETIELVNKLEDSKESSTKEPEKAE